MSERCGRGGASTWGAWAAIALCVGSCATTRAGRREPESPEVREQLQNIQQIRWEDLVDDADRSALSGDFTRSEQYYTAALQRGGPPERILPKLLRSCIGAHRYRAAVEYSRPYLAAHEDAWSLRFLVASIHIGLNEPLTASRHLELVLQHNPNHAEAEFLLASVLRDDLRDLGRADEHFRRYLALEPEGEHARAARQSLLTRVDEAAAQARDAEMDAGGGMIVMPSTDAGAADSDASRRR